jgi:RNA ligase
MRIPRHYIDDGLVTERAHPDDPELFIYNYTPKVQFDRLWDDVTLHCRGLILRCGTIIANPFPKFFNLGELDELPTSKPRRIFGKMDGSLGISYVAPDGQIALATRGSFESEQAIEGTKMLREVMSGASWMLHPDFTYMFEIIYPENRIVVDYGDERKLVLLAVRNTDTGEEHDVFDAFSDVFETPQAYTFHDWTTLREAFPYDGGEGFVVLFADGSRVKLKYEEYTRMHRAIGELQPRRIWEYASDPDLDLEELISVLPDEYYKQLEATLNEIQADYDMVKARCDEDFRDDFATRKEAAAFFTKCPYPGVLFKMLDKRDPSKLIWKLVKPT